MDSLVPPALHPQPVHSSHPSKLDTLLREVQTVRHGSSAPGWRGGTDGCPGPKELPGVCQGFLRGARLYPPLPIFTSPPITREEEGLPIPHSASLSQRGLGSALPEGFGKISGFILSPCRVYPGCLSPKNFIWSLLLLCFHLFPEDLHSPHPPFIASFSLLIISCSYSPVTACAFSQDCGFLIISTRPDHYLS